MREQRRAQHQRVRTRRQRGAEGLLRGLELSSAVRGLRGGTLREEEQCPIALEKHPQVDWLHVRVQQRCVALRTEALNKALLDRPRAVRGHEVGR